MDDIEFKQITEIDDENINIMTNWMYNWWGKEEGYTFEGVRCYLQHSLLKNRLPQTYGAFFQGKIIGMFQLTYEDLGVRPDIYPWLANLYVDEEYRNKGIARILLEKVKEIAKLATNFDEVYLYTEHIGLYEKFNFQYISELDTYIKKPRMQRLYKLTLKEIE